MMKSLERDHSCIRSLAYRMDLEEPSECPAFVALALGMGFVEETPIPGLAKLVGVEGHEILLVRATGRVQLRVSYLVSQDRRRYVAEELYCRIARRWIGASDDETPGELGCTETP